MSRESADMDGARLHTTGHLSFFAPATSGITVFSPRLGEGESLVCVGVFVPVRFDPLKPVPFGFVFDASESGWDPRQDEANMRRGVTRVLSRDRSVAR